MKTTSRWIELGMVLIAMAVVLIACGADQPAPPPVAATNTVLPPPPTEAPTSTPLPPRATEVPTSTPTPAPTDTPPSVPTSTTEKPSAELAEAANQIYTQNSCSACHGVNYEGGLGPILVGLPAERIQSLTRGGELEAGMPAFDQDAISDDELSALAEFLSGLTLQDIDIELSPAVVDHLSQARDALQAGDQAALEAHLKKAQEAGADAPPGVQATLKGLVDGLGEADAGDGLAMNLEALLRQ